MTKQPEMMKKTLLPEFQEFLRVNRLAPENHIPYIALWVSRFLAFLNKSDSQDVDSATFDFIDTLRADRNITDWQVRQAESALLSYFDCFKGGVRLKVLFGWSLLCGFSQKGRKGASLEPLKTNPHGRARCGALHEAHCMNWRSFHEARSGLLSFATRFCNVPSLGGIIRGFYQGFFIMMLHYGRGVTLF